VSATPAEVAVGLAREVNMHFCDWLRFESRRNQQLVKSAAQQHRVAIGVDHDRSFEVGTR